MSYYTADYNNIVSPGVNPECRLRWEDTAIIVVVCGWYQQAVDGGSLPNNN